ncbi:MAG: apolipoprotein N-acyltransferase [Candidatus Binataceae bacterium]
MRSNFLVKASLATASGLALALAFPKFDLSLLAWVAFVPLFYAVEDEPLKRVFGYAWLQGLACYTASLYWVVITLHDFADLPIPIAILPLLLLAAVLALYTGLAIWAGEYVARRLEIPLLAAMPIAWTAVEWLRSFFPIGFPWDLLGYTAWRNLALIQFAEFSGVYGISALIMFFNAVAYAVLMSHYKPRVRLWSLSALSAAMVAAIVFGSIRIATIDRAAPKGTLRVAMVQGDIPQSIKWSPEYLASSFQVYADQSELAARRGADLIVWPEAAAEFIFQADGNYPASFSEDAEYRDRLLQLARRTGDEILFGAPAIGYEDGRLGSYNRAYLVSGQGRVEGYYDKIQLVPFGEYVPARRLLGYFVDRIVHGFGDMIPGTRQTIFNVKGAKLAVLICYESVFPDLTRRAVKDGAGVLVNITNDAWYGASSAPYQLLAMAAMRSVENKVPMVRVANTGISAIISPTGNITAPTRLFVRDTEIEKVAWRKGGTVYSVVGDLFAQICFALTMVAMVVAWSGYRRPKRRTKLPPSLGSRNGTA